MKSKFLLIVAGFILLSLSLSFCDKKEEVIEPPKASFVVSPENGQTTTTFSFNTSGTTNPGLEKPELFYRWDWDGDGLWDTHFSKSTEYEYRYFIPGEYTVNMEVRNSIGLSDTIFTPISVQRGNSAPFPSFSVEPPLGHLRTLFHFDASATYDDEDSLNTLQFRWDWEGDGGYDTEFDNNPIAEHMYPEAGIFRAVLQVTDPWGLTSKTNKLINVSNSNPLLFVDFTWTPENPTTSDNVVLDASSSHDPENPDNPLQFRWDLENDGIYETDWSDNPIFEKEFKTEEENQIKLQIRDQFGLTKSIVKEIYILHSNQAPSATFEVATNYGNLTTDFYFDADGVRDDEDFFNILQVRWDFESDGIFDTDYSLTKVARHFYGVSGDYKITMEVIDSGGLTDITSQIVHVSNGTNETDIVIDEDHGAMYGTVKIGDQWWTSSNVNISDGRSCYRDNASNCGTYGGLYNWKTAMANSTSVKAQGICPNGWHIPSVDDWEELFNFYGEENARTELEPGGSSDFRLLYAGQISTTGDSEFQGTVVNYWSSSRTQDNAWVYSLQKDIDRYWKLTLGQNYEISVRCIKN